MYCIVYYWHELVRVCASYGAHVLSSVTTSCHLSVIPIYCMVFLKPFSFIENF